VGKRWVFPVNFWMRTGARGENNKFDALIYPFEIFYKKFLEKMPLTILKIRTKISGKGDLIAVPFR
jgi:hypothetical protein